jgi:hypothetical protein
MTTKSEARIRAMMDGPAGPPAADVLAAGAAFTITQVAGEEWDLVWFAILTEGYRLSSRRSSVIMKFFLGRHAQSQDTWGRS